MELLQSLRVFRRVAELSSFTQAADALSLPKSRVSTIVRDLEAELGVRLFHRTTRRVHLTHEGIALQERARDLLSDADDVRSMFQSGSSLRGSIRVDMPIGVARNVIIPCLHEFMDAHPHVDVELSSTDRRVDLIKEGFDCIMRVGDLDTESLIARRLGWFPMGNFVSATYADHHGVPTSIDELNQHRMVHYALSFGGTPYGFEDGDDTIAMQGRITVSDSEAYLASCLAGMGIIQAPDIGRIRELADLGTLVRVLPNHVAEPMPVSLLYARRNPSKRVRAFMDWLAATMEPHLDAVGP